MSSFLNFMFGAVLVIIWIIAGGYATQANIALGPHKNEDPELHRAYWYTFWAAFVTWTLIGIFIILIILSVIGVVALFGSGAGEAGVAAEEGSVVAEGGAAEEAGGSRYERGKAYAQSPDGQANIDTGISWLTIGFLIFALILVGITGVLCAIAASSLIKSPNYKPDDINFKTAYNDCVISASICLGAGGLLILGIIIYFIVGVQRQRKIDAEKEQDEKYKQEELAGLHRVQQQAFKQKFDQKAEQREAFEQELQEARQQALIQRAYQQTLQLK